MTFAILYLLLAAPAWGEAPNPPPKVAPQTATMIVPGLGESRSVSSASSVIDCPVGRFVVIYPPDEDKYTYFPASIVKRYPIGTPVIHHVKWDEKADEAGKPPAPKDYSWPEAKGHIAVLFPTADVTVQVWKNGADGPVLFQTYRVKTGQGPRPPPEPDPDPKPGDPLTDAVRAIYGADQSATKKADAGLLASAYRKAAGQVPFKATAADVAQVVTAERAAAVGDRFASVRDVFGGEFAKFIPSDGKAVLTTEQKTAAVSQLNRFSTILEGLR